MTPLSATVVTGPTGRDRYTQWNPLYNLVETPTFSPDSTVLTVLRVSYNHGPLCLTSDLRTFSGEWRKSTSTT